MKKKTDMRALILEALAKLGPSSPRQILDVVGGSEKKLSYYLRALLATGEVKAAGSSHGRVYALKSQSLKGVRSQAGIRPGAVTTLNEALAARTADGRIVLIHADGAGVVTVINAEFADPLAQLLNRKAA